MKKLITLILLLLGGSVIAQNLKSIPKCSDCIESEHIVLHQWQCHLGKDHIFYTYYFDDGAYRMNQAFNILNTILYDNGLTFSKPDIDDSHISDLVDDIYDYTYLDLTVKMGASYMTKLWYIIGKNNLKTKVYFELNEEIRGISIIISKI